VITDAASNSLATGITLSSFQTMVSSAFASNTGGVVDFEVATGWATNVTVGVSPGTVDFTYGSGQNHTWSLTRTDGGFGINSNNNNGTNVVSGSSYFGFQGSNNANLTFSAGLSAFGLTLIPRGASRRSTLTAILDDSSTIVSSQETTNATNAVFFGFRAPTGRTIVGLNFAEPDGFTRYDDLGFVQAVPEPATLTLLALGVLATTRRRSSRS
jgi:hypothetical protein